MKEEGHFFVATQKSFQSVLNDRQKDDFQGTYPIHFGGFQGLEISHTTLVEDVLLTQ